jgi:hypothetical protein
MIDWFRRKLALRMLKEAFKMQGLKGYRTYVTLGAIMLITAIEQFAGVEPGALGDLKQWLYPIAIGFLRAGAK